VLADPEEAPALERCFTAPQDPRGGKTPQSPL
jgi:hypothetical protein